MKISEILSEAAVVRYQKEEIANIIDYLWDHCGDALSVLASTPEYPLWRGFRSVSPETHSAFMFDPSTGTRRSENTTNHYTLLMDNSPYMKGWPKRSKSIIASTSNTFASGYGDAYALLPHDGTLFGICPYQDIWMTSVQLPRLGIDKTTFPMINRICTRAGMDDDSFEEMVTYTKTPQFAEKLPIALSSNIVTADPESAGYFDPVNFIPYLQERMSPKNTGFTTGKLRNLSMQGNVEVWFSSPCVAVSAAELRKIKNKL